MSDQQPERHVPAVPGAGQAGGDPIPNPGMPEHRQRPTDVSDRAADRAERQVAAMFGLSALLTVAFCVAFFAIPESATVDVGVGRWNASNLALGTTLGLALFLIGAGAIHWAKQLMADREIIEERHPVGSTPEEAAGTLEQFYLGAEESGFGRRRLIRGTLIGSLGLLGIPPLILLRDLGPLPTQASERTAWAPGMRVVNDVTLTPIRPAEVEIGQLVNAEPAIVQHLHGAELQVVKADSAVILVRMRPEEINAPVGRADWGVDGILCFSKVCTHVGCPISLYEQQTHKLLCPCHQSTFDLANGARVTFGPAARSLPQLPIEVDDEGYLVARSDFLEPVGPSYWERG